jgi:hypothetical protein
MIVRLASHFERNRCEFKVNVDLSTAKVLFVVGYFCFLSAIANTPTNAPPRAILISDPSAPPWQWLLRNTLYFYHFSLHYKKRKASRT